MSTPQLTAEYVYDYTLQGGWIRTPKHHVVMIDYAGGVGGTGVIQVLSAYGGSKKWTPSFNQEWYSEPADLADMDDVDSELP
jgi:hypothetical protein